MMVYIITKIAHNGALLGVESVHKSREVALGEVANKERADVKRLHEYVIVQRLVDKRYDR